MADDDYGCAGCGRKKTSGLCIWCVGKRWWCGLAIACLALTGCGDDALPRDRAELCGEVAAGLCDKFAECRGAHDDTCEASIEHECLRGGDPSAEVSEEEVDGCRDALEEQTCEDIYFGWVSLRPCLRGDQ
jgi:hypothetical protein